MNKILGAIISIMTLTIITAPTLATTTVDHTWNGAGSFSTHIVADDDSDTTFNTAGAVTSGEFHFVNYEDNPYNYGVNTNDVKVKAHVEGGYIEYDFKKTDNYDRMYGPAGQESYTLIDTYGTGDFAWHSWSNYAQLRNSNHGWQNDNQIQATGRHYIYHDFWVNDNEGAVMKVYGSDGYTSNTTETKITDMCEDHWGSSYKFGKGCGCYTNAKVDITNGSGKFDFDAYADNQITTDNGITVSGPGAHLNIHADFGSEFHYNNFALEGN